MLTINLDLVGRIYLSALNNKISIRTESLGLVSGFEKGTRRRGHGETGVARARFQSMAPSCKSTRHSPRTCRWQ